jgi:hypothetical protein
MSRCVVHPFAKIIKTVIKLERMAFFIITPCLVLEALLLYQSGFGFSPGTGGKGPIFGLSAGGGDVSGLFKIGVSAAIRRSLPDPSLAKKGARHLCKHCITFCTCNTY